MPVPFGLTRVGRPVNPLTQSASTFARLEQPFRSGKRTSAVLLSAEDWSAIQETLYLLAVPGMRESIKTGMAEPLAKSAKALKW